MGYFSSRYSSQPHTLRIYLPWYSCTHIFSCSADNNILRVFFLIASAITCSGTQSWLIFSVYFCLSLLGDTITQMTTIIWPGFKRKKQKTNFNITRREMFKPALTPAAIISDKVDVTHFLWWLGYTEWHGTTSHMATNLRKHNESCKNDK